MPNMANTISIDQFNKMIKSDKGSKGNNPHAVGRVHTTYGMNKTEQAFMNEVIKPGLAAREYLWAEFEPVNLTLARKHNKGNKHQGMCYKPDFMIMRKDQQLMLVEVKAAGRPIPDDSLAKIKMTAEKYFMFIMVLATKSSTGWHFEEF